MKDYFKGYNTILSNPTDLMYSIINHIDQNKQEQRNINAGIKTKNGFYGVPDKGIEFKFDILDFDGKFYIGKDADLDHVFDATGKFLFSAESFDYIGKDIFIVHKDREPKKGQSSVYGALYRDGIKLTDYDFRSKFSSKFDKNSDFVVLGYKDFGRECVINTQGKIVLYPEKNFDNIYLTGNIAHSENSYYNLFTGEVICKDTKSNTLDTKEFLFVGTYYKDQVYKINKFTCEFEIFGEAESTSQINDIQVCNDSATAIKKSVPVIPKQGRNELCNCGAVDENGKRKKYKNCCMKKY
jgi:hypothetical protein